MNPSVRSLITVDLDAVRANVLRFRGVLGTTKLCAVVKADAYGHGALEVGRAASEAGAAVLAVATIDEAFELRDGGYYGPLLVMGPLSAPDEMVALASVGAEFSLVTRDMVEMLALTGHTPAPLRLHLKVDTGMNRLGVHPAELTAVLGAVGRHPDAELCGIMTHFACAGEDPDCVQDQLRVFNECVAVVKPAWPDAVVHAANSAATLHHPDTHLDMVRCGVALYGLSPFQTSPDDDGLRPALTWTSTVAAVKAIEPGAGAGYGHTYRAGAEGRLALIPLGYADGLRRSLGNRGHVLIAGRRQPMVGRISMDSFLVALDKDLDVKAGDPVTLLGQDGDARIPVEEMAALLDTINYEVTCGLDLRRAHRAFVGPAQE